jgi:hypothetical protein
MYAPAEGALLWGFSLLAVVHPAIFLPALPVLPQRC